MTIGKSNDQPNPAEDSISFQGSSNSISRDYRLLRQQINEESKEEDLNGCYGTKIIQRGANQLEVGPSVNNFLVPKGTSFIEDKRSSYVKLSGKIRPINKNSLWVGNSEHEKKKRWLEE